MLYTLYRREIASATVYTVTASTLIQRFQKWQSANTSRHIKLKTPTAKVLFFVGCEHGLNSVTDSASFKPIVNLLKPYVL